MADNLFRNTIYVVVFLSLFFIFVALIPSGFLYSGSSYDLTEYPDFFTKQDLENIRFYESKNITVGLGSWLGWDFNPQGADFVFRVYFEEAVGGYPRRIFIYHMNPWLIWFWQPELMTYDRLIDYGNFLDETEILSVWDSELYVSRFPYVYCDHISINAWFRDPNSTRNDLDIAWDEGTIEVTLGFGFSDFEATIGAWDVVGRLLTFQAIEIGPWYVNGIIAIPIWVGIAFIVYLLILQAIPFVGS